MATRSTLLAKRVPCTTVGAGGAQIRHGDIELPEEFRARYRPEVLLGAGAMGSVYRAHSLTGGGPVAVKFLAPIGDESLRERFLREGRTMMKVADARVVRVLDVQAIGEHPYLVCEYVDGGTLRQTLDRHQRLPPAQAVSILLDVLGGLAACHAHGVVHRDVKPENILLTREGRAKLADLGIAKDYGASDLTAAGMILGTPHYMAPEQVRGEPCGVASDLFAAGAVLYETLTGTRPFTGSNLVDILEAVERAAPRPVRELAPGLSPELAQVVTRLLARRIDERPPSAEDAATMLRRVPENGWVRAAVRRRPRTAAALLVGLLLGVSLLAAGRVHFDRVQAPVDSVVNLKGGEVERWSRMASAAPADARPWFRLALALWKQGDRDAATQALHTTLKLEPTHVGAALNLGNLALEEGQLAEAEGRFRRVLEIDPRSAEAQRNLGAVLLARGKSADALAAFSAAAPGLDTHRGVAAASRLRGDWGPAADALAAAVQLAPDREDVHREYVDALSRAGRDAELVRERQRVLRR